MSRASKQSKSSASGSDRVKALPWAMLLQAGLLVGRRWRGLSAGERRRLGGLVRDSGGRLGSLSSRERKELHKLAGKLDLKGLGRDLMALRGGRSRKGR